jgi:hypothetical protein
MDANEQEPVQPQGNPPADQSATPPSADAGTTPPTDGQQPGDRDAQGRFRNPVQPRIDELTRNAHDAKREAAFWKARAESLAAPPAPPPEPAAKPTPDQFDDYGAYVEALTDWKADQKIDAKLKERDTLTAEQQQHQTRVGNWATREAAVRTAVPDYDEVMGASSVPVTKAVEAELLDSPRGPEIALHLAKNPDIADKLNGMSEREVAREIGRLEASLPAVSAPTPAPTDDTDTPAPPPAPASRTPAAAPRTTNAPPPAKPTGAGRSAAVPLEKMSMDDYVEKRKAQGASWARR